MALSSEKRTGSNNSLKKRIIEGWKRVRERERERERERWKRATVLTNSIGNRERGR